MEAPVCAVATSPGHSAIAVVRITGQNSIPLVEKIFQPVNKKLKLKKAFRKAIYGNLVFQNEILDDVVLIAYKGPASYTGEDMAEIFCHGNPLILKKILKALYKTGFEPARPGEFSRRAVLNGKMDLTQAQAVKEIIEARGEKELQSARLMKEGSFRTHLLRFRSDLLNLSADLTAEFDFAEEDIQFKTDDEKLGMLESVKDEILELIKNSEQMQILHDGYEAVIIGAPNAGKSSLLNYIVGQDRAIVSDVPGTTRDYLESELQIAGMPVKFIDTAGIRETASDAAENQGIARSKEKFRQADICLFIIDASVDPQTQNLHEISDLLDTTHKENVFYIFNKSDIMHSVWRQCIPDVQNGLFETFDSEKIQSNMRVSHLDRKQNYNTANTFFISVKTGANVKTMYTALEQAIENMHPHTGSILMSQWQKDIMEKIHEEIVSCIEMVKAGELAEIIASSLQNCLDLISHLTGEITTEDLLGRIFSRFCIGK